MKSPCPTVEELEALLAGTSAHSAASQLEQHLQECATCRARLDALADGNGSWLGTQQPGGASIDSPPLRDVMKRLKASEKQHEVEFAPPPEPAACPQSLGEYELLEELGRGGMGVVYRAWQSSLKREVALKVILAGQFASAAELRRFQVEAEAAAKLDHPNIVPIFEIGGHEGHRFFSMKRIEGRDLARVIREDRFTPSKPASARANAEKCRAAAAMLATVARAVHYAHQRGVLHRDLKPGNILVDQEERPHVMDFGLARLTERDSSLTQSAAILGTPNYMAPELAAGRAREVTTAADVYGLGAILYEMLTRQPPFQAETPVATLERVVHAEPVSPTRANPAVPRDLATICLKCLEKDPARRYSSAEQLAEDLDRFVRGEPISARPSSLADQVMKWTRRRPAVAALIIVFVAGFAGVVWKWWGEVAQRQIAQREGQRAQQAVTRLEIEHAESLLQAGDTSRGLAGLARLLRQQPTNSVVAERLISALSDRSFCLPVARLQHGPALHSLTGALKEKLANRFAFNHQGSIVNANFSPDGSRVLTASTDGTARLWNARDGRPLGEPMRHEAEILWAQFSDDGRALVTASVDRTARVWSTETSLPTAPPLRHDEVVHFAAFSPDGRSVVTASRDKTARIWDAQTGQPAGEPLMHPAPCVFACYSPDGSRILTADEGTRARLWDARTGASLGRGEHFHFVGSPAPYPRFSPTLEQIVTLRWRAAILRRPQTNLASAGVLLSDDFCTGATYSPDGRRLATVSVDTTARLWNPVTREPLLPPLHHEAEAMSACFSTDGQRLLTSSRDKSARLWDVRTGQALSESMRHAHEVFTASLSAGGQRVVTITPTDAAWLWDVRLLQPWVILRRLKVAPQYARFAPDGRRLLVVEESGTARIWDAFSGEFLSDTMRSTAGAFQDAQFTPDGRRVLTASEDQTVRAWDTSSGQPIGDAWPMPFSPDRLHFSPDGTRVAVVGGQPVARILDSTTGRLFFELRHAARIHAAEFSPDGSRMVTASADGTAQIWEASTGRPAGPPLQHEGEVFGAVFDPKSLRVATASRDKTVRIWSVQTGQLLAPPLGHADSLHRRHSVLFSPDGSRLATAAGAIVQVWNVTNGTAITSPLRHGRLVEHVRFSPSGAKLLTASDDGIVRLWDPETGHAVSEPMRHGGRVTSAEFSPDGMRIATCSIDQAVRIWEVTSAPSPVPAWLPDLAEAVASQQIDAQDVSTVIPVDALYRLRQKLETNAGQSHYDRWARWFFADSATRTVSLLSATTVPEYVQRRIDDGTRDSLHEAARLAPTNAIAFARLARNLASNYRMPLRIMPAMPEDAAWFSSCATNLAPDDAEVRQIRQDVLQKLSTSPKP